MNVGFTERGKPPYVPSDDDIELARKLAAGGISVKGIAAALNISEPTVTAIKERDAEFASALKKGRAENYLECFDLLKCNDISATGFIYLTRTLFKEFYPQEEKQVVDYQNRPDINVTFTNKPEPVVATVQSDTTEKTSDDATDSA